MNKEVKQTENNRLFRAGDKVCITAWRGRHPFDLDMDELLEPGLTGYVCNAEQPLDCCLSLFLDRDIGTEDEGGYYTVPTHFVELLQASESQPFWLEDKRDGRITLNKTLPDGNSITVAIFFWRPHSEPGICHDEAKLQAFHALNALNKQTPEN